MNSPPIDLSASRPVVVAIDDSDAGRAALLWAAEHARRLHAELQVVHVLRYDFGDPVAWAPGLVGAPHTVPAGAVDSTKHLLHQLFLATAPEPSWSLRFLDGPAGHTIVDAAAEAQLLVVGTRGHRGLERLLVGSVSHYCLAHAACPVVSVPSATTTTSADPVVAPLPIGALP